MLTLAIADLGFLHGVGAPGSCWVDVLGVATVDA